MIGKTKNRTVLSQLQFRTFFHKVGIEEMRNALAEKYGMSQVEMLLLLYDYCMVATRVTGDEGFLAYFPTQGDGLEVILDKFDMFLSADGPLADAFSKYANAIREADASMTEEHQRPVTGDGDPN
jgi:hypothetical protein